MTSQRNFMHVYLINKLDQVMMMIVIKLLMKNNYIHVIKMNMTYMQVEFLIMILYVMQQYLVTILYVIIGDSRRLR